MQNKISIEEWHTLPENKKETLRKWAVDHGYGLDIIPSKTSATCDYAALLSIDQMKLFIRGMRAEKNNSDIPLPDDCNYLWKELGKTIDEV